MNLRTLRKRRRMRCQRRGVAALEFAIILPLLITIVLGCVDFGRFAYTYIAVTNAARVGAGFGSVHSFTPTTNANWVAAIQQATRDELCGSSAGNPPLFDASKVTIATPVVTTDSGGQKRVRLTVSYPFEMLIQTPFLPIDNMVITRTVEMRLLHH